MTDRHRKELRYLGLGWCIACALGATLGGIIGLVSWINDDTLEYL